MILAGMALSFVGGLHARYSLSLLAGNHNNLKLADQAQITQAIQNVVLDSKIGNCFFEAD
jgi:hypothetical protein